MKQSSKPLITKKELISALEEIGGSHPLNRLHSSKKVRKLHIEEDMTKHALAPLTKMLASHESD